MIQTFRTPKRHGYSVQFSPFLPQRLACATAQYYGIAGCGKLFVLDVLPGGIHPVNVFDWNEGLYDVTWAEDNENILVTCSGDSTVQVWDVKQSQGPLKVFKEHTKEVSSVDWSELRGVDLVLSASWDKLIKVWDININHSIKTCQGHDHIVYAAVWSPHLEGAFASASGDGTLGVWDSRRPEGRICSVRAHDAEVLTCDWSKYDQFGLFSGAVDGVIKGWDLRNSKIPTCELRGHRYAIRKIRTSPFNGAVVASSSYDFSVKLWDVKNQRCVHTLEHHKEFVYGLDFNLHTPDQMADCGWDELLHVYNTPPMAQLLAPS